jgi:hypothetical protein
VVSAPALARGGWVFVDDTTTKSVLLTDDLRKGEKEFEIDLE